MTKRIPQHGLSKEDVFAQLSEIQTDDITWRDGKTWAYVYDAGREAEAVTKEAFTRFMSANALDPTVFPSLLKFENEVVSMMANHLGGDEDTVGTFTSGGTESIILSVKTARDNFRAAHPNVQGPLEMVLPETAHAAFQKAAHYLDIKAVITPIDPKTFRADVGAMRDAITPNTFLLVGSAPSYAHGVIDPIQELGQLALQNDLPLHVDACIGGFLLPYFKRLGEDVLDFDFSVPGVTSISVDLHKYGFSAKGASVLLHRNPQWRHHQFYACATWAGYTLINNTIQSTKSGGPMAAAWSILHFLGEDGYTDLAQSMLDSTKHMIKGLEAIEDLHILGTPDMNLIAFASDTIDVFKLADVMSERGWYIQPQLGFERGAPNIHLSVNPKASEHLDVFLEDLQECVDHVKTLPSSSAQVNMVRMMFANIDPNSFDSSTLQQMLAMAGIQGTGLPDKMADVNAMLNAIPPALREKLLVSFVNELYRTA